MKESIPNYLSHLPTYRGYPVPYFVPRDENGTYLFKYASGEKMKVCDKHKKCCVCGKKLIKGVYCFISGPVGLSTQSDSHTPMHKRCAEYSLKICPHLFFEKTKRTTDEDDAKPWHIMEKPNTFYLVMANKYKMHVLEETIVVKYSNHKVVSKFVYENGVLSEETN